MREGKVVDTANRGTIELADNLCRCVYQQVDIMQESGRAGSGIRNTFPSGFPTNPASAQGFGDDHAPPGTQNSPFHGMQKELILYDPAWLSILSFTFTPETVATDY
jgi:hypothetical protein